MGGKSGVVIKKLQRKRILSNITIKFCLCLCARRQLESVQLLPISKYNIFHCFFEQLEDLNN
jgi:hypothetical protein